MTVTEMVVLLSPRWRHLRPRWRTLLPGDEGRFAEQPSLFRDLLVADLQLQDDGGLSRRVLS